MKRIYFTIIILSSLFIASCDKIDEPYTLPVPAKDWYGKKVLIEDYTGHKCPNCPEAAVIANNIKTLYGEKVIVIAVHAGYFAQPSPTLPENFTTAPGDAWDTFFGNSNAGNPNGLINRKGYPNSHILQRGEWAGKVSSVLSEIPELELSITKSYNQTDKKVSGQVKAKFLKTIKKKLKLQIIITEDSIVAPQINAGTLVLDYVHRHVMRTSVNGIWGSTLTDGASYTFIDAELSQGFQYTLDPTWDDKHCSLVVFVYDDVSKEILQAEEIHIK